MKSFLLPLCSALALSIAFTSCKKDKKEDPAPVAKTKTELISGKNWKLTGGIINPAADFGTGTPTTDAYSQVNNCRKDDLLRFDTPNVYKQDEGATKCSASDLQTETGTWAFSMNETKITTSIASGSPKTYNLVELTETTLKTSEVINIASVSHTVTSIYTKQ